MGIRISVARARQEQEKVKEQILDGIRESNAE
jgi:hypothetical protein